MSHQACRKLVIFSGPSGAGKSTVVRQLVQRSALPLKLSVSATTRPPRPGETDGVDYHFLSHEQFQAKRKAGDFLECEEVFDRGDWYGTLQSEVTASLDRGDWVVLEIDVQGALAVLEKIPHAITIFIHPGSLEELEKRLRERGTEPEETITRRLQVAGQEMQQLHRYRHEIINDSLDRAVNEIDEILNQYAQSQSSGEKATC